MNLADRRDLNLDIIPKATSPASHRFVLRNCTNDTLKPDHPFRAKLHLRILVISLTPGHSSSGVQS